MSNEERIEAKRAVYAELYGKTPGQFNMYGTMTGRLDSSKPNEAAKPRTRIVHNSIIQMGNCHLAEDENNE